MSVLKVKRLNEKARLPERATAAARVMTCAPASSSRW